MPQPVATTIQPEFWPLDLLRTTFATTPSPRVTSSIVPINSAANLVMTFVRPGKYASVVIKAPQLLSIGFYQGADRPSLRRPAAVDQNVRAGDEPGFL